ncbi:MAG: BMP family ABC transporter substrate-binding protein [Clostridia bacterium]
MKKIAALLLALVMVFAAVACKPAATADTYEIALVTDVGNIDDKSFNQGAWEGVKAYAEANKITYNYYRPTEDSTAAREETIKTAIDKGAKVVVCPGFLFAETLTNIQDKYPDTMFLALDVSAKTEQNPKGDMVPSANTALITYQEDQVGYMAGYAAVKDGYTKLGFLGGIDVPAVVRFGYGYVQGVNDAAKEMGIVDKIDMKYWYCGGFAPSDDIKTKMSGWYTEGTEVVFACGGGIYLSAVGAAEEASAKVIGVDRDQAGESDLFITSATKSLSPSVEIALGDLYKNEGKWSESYAGKETKLGAAQNCVGLPTVKDSWRLTTFTVEEYEALFTKIANGEVVISSAIDVAPTVDIKVDYQF